MTILLLSFAYTCVLALAGLGIVAPGARRDIRWLAAAPLTGGAMLAAIATGLSPWLPLATAAWAVLLPILIGSAVTGIIILRRGGVGRPAALADPALLFGAGLLLAALPSIIRRTTGPIAFQVYDSLGYTATDLWLSANSAVAETIEGSDLLTRAGTFYVAGNQRIGVSALNATVAEWFGLQPSIMLTPLLAVALASLATGCWLVARLLGAGRIGGLVAGAWGLSPATFMLVADTTLGNLVGLAFVALLVAATLAAVRSSGWRMVPVAAVGLAGLVACYPELLTPTIILMSIGGVVFVARDMARHGLRGALTHIGSAALPTSTTVLLAAALTPEGTRRAVGYVREIATASLAERFDNLAGATSLFDSLPPRWLTPVNGGSWLFGSVHLYELQRWDARSATAQLFLVLLTLGLFAIVMLGVWRRALAPLVIVLGGIGTASVIGFQASQQYGTNGCEYCAWKALTFALPFVAVGLGLGTSRLVALSRGKRGRLHRALAGSGLLVIILGLVMVGVADARLVRGLVNSPSAVSADLRDATAFAAAHSGGKPVLLEGLEGRPHPFYELGMAYFLTSAATSRPAAFVASEGGVPYLTPPNPRADAYFTSDYGTVLTAFPDMKTGRTEVERSGAFAVQAARRRDAVIAGPGVRVDPDAKPGRGIPWLIGPADVWVRTSRAPTTLRIEAISPNGEGFRSVSVRALSRQPLAVRRYGDDGRNLCITLPNTGVQRIRITPVGMPIPKPQGRATEEEVQPRPPAALGISRLDASGGPCPRSEPTAITPDIVDYGRGWSGPEPGAPEDLPFRWMTARAGTLTVGEPGGQRPRQEVRLFAEAFLEARTMRISIGGNRYPPVAVPPGQWTPITINVPPGAGILPIKLIPEPGPQPISPDGPGDPRSVSVRVAIAHR
jgi:hypothetical protein